MRTERFKGALLSALLITLLIVATISLQFLGNQDSYSLMNPVVAETRGVEVSISPTYQGGVIGATLTYTVTVTNTGSVYENYTLTISDNENWGPSLSENLLENVPPGENRVVTLSVEIPSGEVCTLDNITVTATSKADNSIMGSDDSIAHRGKAKMTLYIKWCYGFGIRIDLNLLLREDSRNLVAKFYNWVWTYEAETVVWSGATPAQVVMVKEVPHPIPMWIPKGVRLVLTDEEDNEVQTVSTSLTRKSDFILAISQMKAQWPFYPPENRYCIIQMLSAIKGQWPFAPS